MNNLNKTALELKLERKFAEIDKKVKARMNEANNERSQVHFAESSKAERDQLAKKVRQKVEHA